MFGAPFGAFTGWGKSLTESLARRLIVPLNGAGGVGSTTPPDFSCASASVDAEEVIIQPRAATAQNTVPPNAQKNARLK